MRKLLSLEQTRRTPLMKGPYISLSRAFTKGASLAELADQKVIHPLVANLAEHPYLYGHQEKAIRAIHARKPTLISTGTGSGKTEGFLYPIISHCLTLRDESTAPGISAVLIYPMNALAEDQLGRLRDLLAGTGITFGLYVGKTPEHEKDVTGERLAAGSSRQDYRAALKKSQDEKRESAVHPPEEHCSREKMRTPGEQPRILLTNVKQLELLLTRQQDVELFAGARLDFLVCDEAHTYSGVGGAETACLIRRLRSFCRKKSDETVCVAASATITDPRGGTSPAKSFMSRFFGVPEQRVEVVIEEYEQQSWAAQRHVPAPASGEAAALLKDVLQALDANDDDEGAKLTAVLKNRFEMDLPAGNWEATLYDALSRNELVYQLAEALKRPRLLGDLPQELAKALNRTVSEEEILAWLALGAATRKEERALLRPVVHIFIRGIGGAVVSFPENRNGAQLWLSAEDEAAADPEDHLVRLPVTTCSTCGQHYFVHYAADFEFTGKAPEGGEAVADRVVWKALDFAHGGKRLVLFDRLISADDENGEAPAHTAEVFLCRSCGALHPAGVERCDACGRAGPLVRLFAVVQGVDEPGSLKRCLSCGSTGHDYGGSYREPARPVKAVTVSDVHVLAQDMLHNADRKRLLVFADSGRADTGVGRQSRFHAPDPTADASRGAAPSRDAGEQGRVIAAGNAQPRRFPRAAMA